MYDPKNVTFAVNGVPIIDVAKGTFIEFEFMEPRTSSEAGAQGAVNTALSRDRRGRWKLVLMNKSISNQYLEYVQAQHDSGISASAVMEGPNGGYTAAVAYVSETGKLGYSEKPDDNREWTIEGEHCVPATDGVIDLIASGLNLG